MPSRIHMAKKQTLTCQYANCCYLHETRDVNRDEAVKDNSNYFHKDCFEVKKQIQQFIELFKQYMNPHPVYNNLYQVINDIVFAKGVDIECLIFGIKYYVEHGRKINYPAGLYYMIQNRDMMDAYNKQKVIKVKQSIELKDVSENTFTHKAIKNNGFGDILK